MCVFQIVNDKVFPQIQNGFLDQEPAIREKTVIAVIHLAPKLNFANLDECVVSSLIRIWLFLKWQLIWILKS